VRRFIVWGFWTRTGDVFDDWDEFGGCLMMDVRGLEVTFDGDQHIHCFGLDTQLGLRCRAVPAQWFLILVFFFLASPTMLSGNYCMLDEFEKALFSVF
jgi:hypothetical protein